MPSAVGDERVDSTPFRMTTQGQVVVGAALNGSGPFPFVLDTGSSHSTISADLARLVGAPPVARTVVVSPIGEDVRAVVRLDRLTLGPVTAQGLLPSVVPLKTIDAHGIVHGIIGQDVLAAHCYTIEFVNRRIVWHQEPVEPSGGHSTLNLEFELGRFMVELPQANGVLRMVPDSGAAGLVLFVRADRPLPALALAPAPRIVELGTLSAQRDVRQVMVRELRVGRATVRDWPAALVEGYGSGGDGDGLLPLHPFERVTFDGPRRRLLIVH
jgi:hypothetical protein